MNSLREMMILEKSSDMISLFYNTNEYTFYESCQINQTSKSYAQSSYTHVKNTICPICLEIMSDQTVILKCLHCYHKTCFNRWTSYHKNCPLCRKKI